jgi:hypothetical protein
MRWCLLLLPHLEKDRLYIFLIFLQLSSVGLDVYPNEPQVNFRLLEFPQVALLPHMDRKPGLSAWDGGPCYDDFLTHGQEMKSLASVLWR